MNDERSIALEKLARLGDEIARLREAVTLTIEKQAQLNEEVEHLRSEDARWHRVSDELAKQITQHEETVYRQRTLLRRWLDVASMTKAAAFIPLTEETRKEISHVPG